MHQNRWRPGLRPRPHWRSFQRSPASLAGLRGPTCKGRGKGGEGRERRRDHFGHSQCWKQIDAADELSVCLWLTDYHTVGGWKRAEPAPLDMKTTPSRPLVGATGRNNWFSKLVDLHFSLSALVKYIENWAVWQCYSEREQLPSLCCWASRSLTRLRHMALCCTQVLWLINWFIYLLTGRTLVVNLLHYDIP